MNRCKIYERTSGELVLPLLKRTKQAINDVDGKIIERTAEEVDGSMVDAQGWYIRTAPQPRIWPPLLNRPDSQVGHSLQS